MALRQSECEYDLVLQNDINTKGHTQWYYFRVTNTCESLRIKFNIINLCKPGSIYNSGMKVMIRSEAKGPAWFRGGEDISYFCNGIKRNSAGKSYYTLTFTHQFSSSHDTVYFAYSMPYTFSNIMKYLQELEEDEARKQVVCRRLLTYTLTGNRCDYLTVSSPSSPEDVRSKKKGVVVTARVHPGETVGSWMMHGFIDFITGSSAEARVLRENFVFKIVPMLNPDGVVNGNYRCDWRERILNRRWKDPVKTLHPTIWAAKRMIKAFSKEREIEMICDLHGHSRKHNIFMYGCNVSSSPEVTRAYPYILSKSSEYFSYQSCTFRVQKSKESTMRVSLFKETRIPFIYTMEASFGGCDFGAFAGLHLTAENLMRMGKDLCMAIMLNNNLTVDPNETPVLTKSQVLESMKNDPKLLETNGVDSSSGSDSDPSEDDLDAQEMLKLVVPPAKPRIYKENQVSPQRKGRFKLELFTQASSRRNQSLHIQKKCQNCGEIEDLGHVCSKNKGSSRGIIKKIQAQTRTRDNSAKRSMFLNLHLNATAGVFPSVNYYLNPEGKRVRDQSTQTEAASHIKKVESIAQSQYLLDANENLTKTHDVEGGLLSPKDSKISTDRFRQTTYIDREALPCINKGKLFAFENYSKAKPPITHLNN